MRPRIRWLSIFLSIVFLSGLSANIRADNIPSDEDIQKKIQEAQTFYQAKYRTIEEQVNQMFQINFSELKQQYESKMNEINMKSSIIDKIDDPLQKDAEMKKLQAEYQEPDLYKYIEANSYYENEIEKDHLFAGELLERLENILEMVSQKDPVFKYAFYSGEFKNQYGLVLKRVVWGSTTLQNVSAETSPINVHSVFGDKTKIPALIKFTPIAFYNLAFLRSIVIHELNHACFYKDPAFADVTKFSGGAMEKAEGGATHYFKSLNPYNPTYQYHLIHEYYSFKTQLIFDELTEDTPYFRLDPANKKNTENMLNWTYSQFNDANKKFIEQNPNPPIMKVITKFYKPAR